MQILKITTLLHKISHQCVNMCTLVETGYFIFMLSQQHN